MNVPSVRENVAKRRWVKLVNSLGGGVLPSKLYHDLYALAHCKSPDPLTEKDTAARLLKWCSEMDGRCPCGNAKKADSEACEECSSDDARRFADVLMYAGGV